MNWQKPNENVTGLDAAFGPHELQKFLPSMQEIPKQFHDWNNPWSKLVSGWFFDGLKTLPRPQEGIDEKLALFHLGAIMRSFEPKHEHKIAGCAYLMSLWFLLPKGESK